VIQKVLDLTAVAYYWSVEVQTAELCSALCRRQQPRDCAVRHVIVQNEDWIILLWDTRSFWRAKANRRRVPYLQTHTQVA